MRHSPLWPALIHYAGQPELTLLPDANTWSTTMHHRHYRQHDRMVDSTGRLFHWQASSQVWETNGDTVSLADLLEWIRTHASTLDQCCVAKFAAGSYAEAFRVLAELENEDN